MARIATEQANLDQDANDTFSMIPASRVFYYDSNNKQHFMDEGMFLGTYDTNGEVLWDMRFDSTATNNVNFILSKKPLDFNTSTSDYPQYSVTVGGVENIVPAGSTIQLQTNQDIKIKVPDILKGDELYMVWWPSGTEYVELTKFDNYYINAEM